MKQSRFFRNGTSRHAIIALAGFTMASLPAAYAQIDTGQIVGTVTDPSGAVVPNAQISVRNLGTDAIRTETSGANGTYTVTNLPAAHYEVTVTAPGFQGYTQQAEVTVGGHPTLDVKLTVGQGEEKVTVTAASGGAEVNTQTQELSQIIGTEQVSELPSLTRNPYDFVGISGNVSAGDSSQGKSQNTGPNPPRGAGGYSLNGQRASGTEILLDGVENTDLFGDAVGQTVPIDSVQEYRVITNNFSAQFGRASGGVVNVITKAGTNRFHGGAWEFNRLSAYTANTYDNAVNDVPKGQYTRNQFGFDVGGPIKKDKMFFFESTEWLRVRSAANQISLVPDPAFIAASSPAIQQYFAAYGKNQPAANNGVITAGQLRTTNKLANTGAFSALAATTPVFDQVAFTAPTDAGGGAPGNQYYLNGRVDYNVNDATQSYVRYALWKFTNQIGYDFSSPYAQYEVGDGATDNSVLWNISHVFSPTLVSNTKLSFTRFNALDTYNTAIQDTPALFLFNNAAVGSHNVQLPGFYSAQTGEGGLPYGGPQNTIEWNQDLNQTRGAHQLQFGAEVLYIQSNRAYGAYAQADEQLGTSIQSGLNNFVSGTNTLFQAAVNPNGALPCEKNYLTGLLTQTAGCSITLPASSPNFARSDRFHDWAVYGQDAWKATQRFTLDYGLRYEYYGIQHNNDPNLDSNFYYGAGPGYANEVRNGQVFTVPNSPIKELWKPSYGTVAPRVGFALDLSGDGKTSLRGGYGISYERNFGNVTFNVIQNPPNYAVIQVANTPVTNSNAGPLGGANGSVALPPTSLRNVDENIKTAQTQFWSLALERQIVPNTVVSLQYAAARGTHLYDIKNYNELGAGNIQLGDTFHAPGSAAFAYSRPNNQYSSINNRGSNGDSYYEAVNIQLQSSNLAHSGVNLVANYTYGHSIDDVSSTFSESNSASNGVGNLGYLNPYNPGLDRGSSDFDIRQRFVLAPVWQTPWFHDQHNLKGEALGGYTVSGIYSARTGAPFTFSDSSNSLNAPYGQGIVRYTPAPGAGAIPLKNTKAHGSLGPNDFVLNNLPTALDFGNAAYGPSPTTADAAAGVGISDFGPYPTNMTGRNAFTAPGAWSFDLAASKSFPIREGISMEARAEGFDILNHHNLYAYETQNDIANYGYTGEAPIQAKKGGVNGGANDERRFGQFALKVNF